MGHGPGNTNREAQAGVRRPERGAVWSDDGAARRRSTADGKGNPLPWMHEITENPAPGQPRSGRSTTSQRTRIRSTFTRCSSRSSERVDEHGVSRGPEAWETGTKDTVIAYPGEITRVKATFDREGRVRLALPHPRARRQRDDAPLRGRSGSETEGLSGLNGHARRLDDGIPQFHDDMMCFAVLEERNRFRIDGDAVDFG